jgi:tRNA (cytidine32/uridine32-2'-O)-methyltransferase
MKNMGLLDLALVQPKKFPHTDATARASGAVDVLENATVVDSLDEAIKDCVFTAAASARSRSINWPCMEPRECAAKLLNESQAGPVAAVFGPEKYGLTNAHLDLCDTSLTIPTNPDFSSLNLGMAVQILTYELRAAGVDRDLPTYQAHAPLATSAEMEHFYAHLEKVLTELQFLNPDNPRHLMRRLRRLFIRANPDQNEVNILRGILSAVDKKGSGNG